MKLKIFKRFQIHQGDELRRLLKEANERYEKLENETKQNTMKKK